MIENEILPAIVAQKQKQTKSTLCLENFELKEFDAIIKYISINPNIREVNFSNTNLDLSKVQHLVIEITKNQLGLNMLNLSNNPFIDDQVANTLSLLFYAKSSIKKLILNGTSITYKGLISILKSTAKNIKVCELFFVDCPNLEISTPE